MCFSSAECQRRGRAVAGCAPTETRLGPGRRLLLHSGLLSGYPTDHKKALACGWQTRYINSHLTES